MIGPSRENGRWKRGAFAASLAITATSALALESAPSAAEPSSSDTRAAKRAARDRIERANEAFKAARYEEAAGLFIEAHELIETNALASKPELLYNAGLALERIDACDRVAELYGRYLERKPEAATPDLSFRLEKARECAPDVTVETEPRGARIAIDGVERGLAPLKLNLRTGAHTLSVHEEGYVSEERSFSVEARRPVSFTLRLAPEARESRIALDLTSGTELWMDGERVVSGPYRGMRPIAPGPHRIRIERAGCTPKIIPIEVAGGADPVPIDASLECTGATLSARATEIRTSPITGGGAVSPWVWGTAGVGAASAAATVVLAVLSNQAVERRDAERAKGFGGASDRIVRDEQETALALAIGAHLTLATAAVSLVGAGLMLCFDGSEPEAPPPEDRARPRAGVALGPRGAELSMEW